jgi:hypothetical protein
MITDRLNADPRPNTHVLDPLPDSPADTEVPCAIVGQAVYVDLINLTRILAAEASCGHLDDEANDADASLALRRVESLIEHHPVDDGWCAIGTVERFVTGWNERLWMTDAEIDVCRVWLPNELPTLSAAWHRTLVYPLRESGIARAYGEDA